MPCVCIYIFSILREASVRRPWAKQVYNLVAREEQSREPRVVLARSQIRCAINKSFYEYMLSVRQWRHVALRHGAFCVSRQHGLCRWWPAHFQALFRKGSCLFNYETMFTIGESQAISNSDDTEKQAQQVAGNPRFSTETPLEKGRLKFIASEEDDRRQQEAARKAQRTSLSTQGHPTTVCS